MAPAEREAIALDVVDYMWKKSMNWLRRASSEPLWKEEFSVHSVDERYITRRQLTKFLVLTSCGEHLDSGTHKAPSYPQRAVARLGEIPVGGVKL
jgi:hypothetical protein